ncbi:MAG: dual specificity protein phosphatase family protein, partial [Actinomycetota bacterium]
KPPKDTRPHIMGALVGAVISLFLPRAREAETLFSRIPIFPLVGPFGRREQQRLDPSRFGSGLWNAIGGIRTILRDLGNPPSDADDLDSWIESLPMKIDATNEETALLSAVPLAIASVAWSDDVIRKMREHFLGEYRFFFGSQWVAASLWVYFIMLRSALLKNNPVQAGRAEIDVLPEEMQDAFRVILSRGWSPSWDTEIECLSMRCVAHAAWIIRTSDNPQLGLLLATDDSRLVQGSAPMIRILAGALVGGVHGIHRIPSALSTYARVVMDDQDNYRFPDSNDPQQVGTSSLWDLQNIALELAGFPPVKEAAMEPAVGPANVAEGLYAANLMGALDTPTEWCVVSLCRTGDRFQFHAYRRQIYLIDQEGDANPDLATVVQDAVDAIDLFLAQGRPVVVHCHGGRSRTGLILKAWKMRKDGVDEEAAHEWLKALWPPVNRSNQTFTDFLRNEWPTVMKDFEND